MDKPEGTMRTGPKAMSDARNAARFQSLTDACDLGVEEGWGFDLSEIKRVEARWELIDGDAIAHGFVVERHDGQRAYLSYCWHCEDGEPIEHGELVPMGAELFPQLSGMPHWTRDVNDLNARLRSQVLQGEC
jgi:hypothetical protein